MELIKFMLSTQEELQVCSTIMNNKVQEHNRAACRHLEAQAIPAVADESFPTPAEEFTHGIFGATETALFANMDYVR